MVCGLFQTAKWHTLSLREFTDKKMLTLDFLFPRLNCHSFNCLMSSKSPDLDLRYYGNKCAFATLRVLMGGKKYTHWLIGSQTITIEWIAENIAIQWATLVTNSNENEWQRHVVLNAEKKFTANSKCWNYLKMAWLYIASLENKLKPENLGLS